MTAFTVAITGVVPDPEVYGGLDAAVAYIGTKLGPAPTRWREQLTPDDRARSLVEATRYLDQQRWPGKRTGTVGGTPTTLAWPRSGVVLADGTAIDPAVVPREIVDATFELAVLVASDPAITGKVDQGSNIASVSAGGGVGVTFFAPTSAARGTAPVLPPVVQRLVARLLGGSAGGATEVQAGIGSPTSAFSRRHSFRVGEPQ